MKSSLCSTSSLVAVFSLTLSACGDAQIESLQPESMAQRGLALVATGHGGVGQSRSDGHVWDVVDSTMYERRQNPGEPCDTYFSNIDAKFTGAMQSREMAEMIQCLNDMGVPQALGDVHNACGGESLDPLPSDSPACAESRKRAREAAEQCTSQIQAVAELAAVTDIREGIEEAARQGCYEASPTQR